MIICVAQFFYTGDICKISKKIANCSQLILSQTLLLGQNLLYIQAFDEQKRQHLTSLLEKEKWKSSALEFGLILNRIQNLPSLVEAFQLKKVETNGVEKVDEDKNGDEKNGVEKNGDEEQCNGVLNNNIKEDIQIIIDKNPGSIIVSTK